MSIQIMSKVWADPYFTEANHSELMVALVLADHANDAGFCWPSNKTIAAKARTTVRNVQRAVSQLEDVGKLRRSFRVGTSNLFRFTAYVDPTVVDQFLADHGMPEGGGDIMSGGGCGVRGGMAVASPKSSVNHQPPPKAPQRGAKKRETEAVPFPLLLNTDKFRSAWDSWCLHRRQRGQKLTALSQERQLNKLVGWGEERAITAINFSIEQGYTGIYEPKDNGANQRHTARRAKGTGTGWHDAAPVPAGSYDGIGKV